MLTDLIKQYVEAKTLTNGLYAMYKTERDRVDSFESQIREQVTHEPLSDKEKAKVMEMLNG